MRIEKKLSRVRAAVGAKFVAFVRDSGEIISFQSDEKTEFPVDILSGLVKTLVRTGEIYGRPIVEMLCTGLAHKIAVSPMTEGALKGFIVVGMRDDFDMLAMRGVLKQFVSNHA